MKIKGRQSLWKYIKQAFYLWNKNKDRTSWLYCPICDHDLNGDNDSFIKETKWHWHYKCSNCGCESKFHLYSIMPIIDTHQHLKKKQEKYISKD